MSLARRRATPNEAVTVPSGGSAAEHPFLRLELAADLLGEPRRLDRRNAGHDDGEFLAADPRGEIVAARRRAQDVGELLEHHVADRVAEFVVDRLEAVEVAHQQAQRLGVPQREIDLLIEETPVAESGQLIAQRLVVGLGEIGAQLFDLVDQLVEAGRQLVHLGLDLAVLVDQRQHHGADFVRRVQLRQIGVGARQRFRIAGVGGDVGLQQLDDQREIGGEALLGGVEAALRRRLENERRRSPAHSAGVGEARPYGEHAERDHAENAGFDERILDRLTPDQAAEHNDSAHRGELQRNPNEMSQCHPPGRRRFRRRRRPRASRRTGIDRPLRARPGFPNVQLPQLTAKLNWRRAIGECKSVASVPQPEGQRSRRICL